MLTLFPRLTPPVFQPVVGSHTYNAKSRTNTYALVAGGSSCGRRRAARNPASTRPLLPAEKPPHAAKSAGKALIQSAALFDAFEGGSLGAGRKSIAISVTLQAPDRTLSDDDIAAAAQKIVAAVTKATGGALRS